MQPEELFPEFLRKNCGVSPDSNLLVAVSGGPDSLVLLHLLHTHHFGKIAAAHCNYGMRGAESDKDQELVEQYCQALNIPLHVRAFDTRRIAEQTKKGIQESARELRYQWFRELCKQHHFALIATAHHADDQAETVLMHMGRGAGIKGIMGIQPRNRDIIRPMLYASKEQWLHYADRNRISYRIDSSNLKSDYTRNKIRNEVIPVLLSIYPHFEAHVSETAMIATQYESLLQWAVVMFKRDHCTSTTSGLTIPFRALFDFPEPALLLYALLAPYGFSKTVVSPLLQTDQLPSGKRFHSLTHELLIDREEMLIRELVSKEHARIDLESLPVSLLFGPHQITFDVISPEQLKHTGFEAGNLYLDASITGLSGLYLRHWQAGDAFQPLGMNGTKKLSDFFIDAKIPTWEKEHSCMLCTKSGQIAAVIPNRIDHHFAVGPDTSGILRICIEKSRLS